MVFAPARFRFAESALVVAAIGLLAFWPHPAASAPPLPSMIVQAAAQLNADEAQIRVLGRQTRQHKGDDAALKSEASALSPIDEGLDSLLAQLSPYEADADRRLAQLGPAPKPGALPEAPQIAQTRASVSRFREETDTQIKRARLLAVEVDQLESSIQARRRALFAQRLWRRSPAIFDQAFWTAPASALPGDIAHVKSVWRHEARLQGALHPAADAAPEEMAAAAILALLILVAARVLLQRWGRSRIAGSRSASPLRRALLALWITAVATASPAAALLILREGLFLAWPPNPLEGALIWRAIGAILFACFFQGLAYGLLAPGRTQWRLAPLSDAIAARLAPWLAAVGAVGGLCAFIAGAEAALGVRSASAEAVEFVALLIETVVVVVALCRLAVDGGEAAERGRESRAAARARTPWVIALAAAWLTTAVALLAAATGYLALAEFLVRELIWIVTVLGAVFLSTRFVDALFPALLSANAETGRFVRQAVGLTKDGAEQLAVLLSGIFHLALLLLGWAAIIAPFGEGAGELFGNINVADLTLHLGQLTLTPGEVAGAIAIFGLGVIGTRAVRSWLESRYLPTTRMDVGVQTSLAAVFSYLGALLALVGACAYLGVGLDRIALMASALSVGVGFGLQSVIANFVSGLVLLAERPLKVGDWIAIGDLEGDVKRIRVRATEVEMPDRSKLIVPNSDLISKMVRNVTHSGAQGRIRIVLPIAAGADPIKVRDLVMASLQDHEEVAAEPAPAVYLSDVKIGSLEFTAIAYVASPRLAYRVKSELLFAIVPALRAEGVALADSSPVIQVGLPDPLIEPAPAASNEARSAQRPRRAVRA